MPVVVARVAALLVTEADQLAPVGGRGLEPDLLGVRRRVVEGGRRGERAGGAVETGGGAGSDVGAGAQGDAAVDVARHLVLGGVGHGRAVRLVQPPEEQRAVSDDLLAVRVGRSRRQVDGAPATGVVVTDLGQRQRGRVDRHVVDGAGELVAAQLARPPVEVVAAHPPVARVGLSGGGARVGALQQAVDVELHAGAGERGHDVVVLAVVVGAAGGHGPDRVRVDAEGEVAGVVEVDLAVIATAVGRLVAAEADDLAAAGRGGGEPRLGREGVGAGLGGGLTRHAGVGAAEGGRRVWRAGDGSGRAVGDAGAEHQVVAPDPVDRLGLAGGLVETPVVGGAVVGDGLGVRAVVHHGRAGGDRGRAALRGVAARVGGGHVVAVGLAVGQTGVGEDLGRPVPELRGDRPGLDRGGGPAAVELVGQLGVVPVVVREPGDAHRGAGDAAQRRGALGGLTDRALLVGGEGGDGEPHQTLLGGAVHGRELTALHDVGAGGLRGPATLGLAGVGAGRNLGVPVDDRGRGLALEAVVAARVVRPGGGGGVHRVRVGPLPAVARVGVGEAVHVRAVVGVADGVDHPVRRRDVIAVAVAVGHRLDGAAQRVGLEHALKVPGAAEPVAGAVDVGVVGLQAPDGGRRAVVLDHGVRGERVQHRVRGVERAEAGRGGAVQVGEGAADDQPRLVRGQRHRLHGAVRGRRPGQRRAVGRADCGQPGAGDAVHGGEVAAEVDGGVADRDREDVGAGDRGEGGDQRAVSGVERRHPAAGEAVDRGERADDVEPRLVRRDRHRTDPPVDGRGEAGVEDAGLDVVGEQVGAGAGADPGCRTRGAHVGELAAHVDGVADDGLVPGHPVDLGRGQRVRGDAGGGVAVHHVVAGVGGRGRRSVGQDDQAGGQDSSGQQAGEATPDERRRERHEVIPESEMADGTRFLNPRGSAAAVG